MTIVNNSGLRPVGRAVLVEAYEPEIKKSVIAIPDAVRERSLMVETRATVIEIGPDAWADDSSPRAVVGDKVLISKYCGAIAVGPKDNKPYRLINSGDIYCRIED